MQTALDVLYDHPSSGYADGVYGCSYYEHDEIAVAMIAFAKMHVQAALLKASEEAMLTTNEESTSIIIHKPSILNAYSLDNIK